MYRFHANVRPSRLQVVSTRYRRMRNLPGTQGPFAVLVSDALAISEVNARAATNILMTHLHSANIAHAAGLHRSHDLWPAEGIRVPTVERDRKLRIAAADLVTVRLQGEVAGVEEAHLGVWNVALERLGARRQEKRVVLAPSCQKRRLVLAKIGLEFGI